MALMILKRLPTEQEVENLTIEVHSFLNEFNENSIAPFVAKVRLEGETIWLNQWRFGKADWFSIVVEK
jgi:hypothetical protein